MKQRINILSIILFLSVVLTACSHQVENPQKAHRQPAIYPDYIGVTIPAGIAPLNFCLDDESIEIIDVTVRGEKEGYIHEQGKWTDFDIDEWKQLTTQNLGAALTLTVCALKDGQWIQYDDFNIHISPFPLTDYGLTYRRIPPGYEVGGPNIGIFQRDIHSFKETALLSESAVFGHCMNCHTANRTDPSTYTLQLRGANGGTLVQQNGKQLWFNTRTDSTKAAGSYAYWHPSGNYCAYAANSVHQSFFVGNDRRIEAYHTFSNIILLNVKNNEIILSPLLQTEDLEIFPAFSADGKYLYYSTSKPCDVPAEYEKVKCSLCRIAFDEKTGKFGESVDTIINARQTNKSVTLARPSYDGKWLMYCLSERSNFPIFQNDADLWLMNLENGETRPLNELNSNESDSYHNWSSDSHWFVFSSKRQDGVYAQLYIASIDDQGKVTKPFLLPQRNPRKYYWEMFDSYNVPDFTKTPVELDAHEVHQHLSDDRIQVKIKDRQ